MQKTVALLGLTDAMEKSAGKWNNAGWETLGSLATGGAGALLSYLLANKVFGVRGDNALTAIATAGGIAPALIGGISGLLSSRRTAKEQEEADDSVGEAVADMLIPGYASFNSGRRARARMDDSDAYNNVLHEQVGEALWGPLGLVADGVGGIAGLIAPTRSKEEQIASDKDGAIGIMDMLIPGVAGYQRARRIKADYK